MFLTRMALDVNRQETEQLLKAPEKLRDTVAAAFSYGSSRVLWRIDELSFRTWLVMLSPIRPDLHEVHQRYGYLGAFPSWETLDYDRVLDEVDSGTMWDFELVAAPVGVAAAPRAEWSDEIFLTEWLRRQGEVNGFRVQRASLLRTEWIPVADKQLLVTRWEGRLCVTDEDLFLWALSRGIGGSTAFGAGLMTIEGHGNVWGI